MGRDGAGAVVRRKWRQLYFNNNTKKEKKEIRKNVLGASEGLTLPLMGPQILQLRRVL